MASNHASQSAPDVAEVQRLLSALGYPVPRSEAWNDDTRKALRTYLAERGLATDHVKTARSDTEHDGGIPTDPVSCLRDDVATLQLQLKVASVYHDSITGVVDDKTIAALEAFKSRANTAGEGGGHEDPKSPGRPGGRVVCRFTPRRGARNRPCPPRVAATKNLRDQGYSVRRRPRGSSRGPGLFRRRRVRLPLHRLRRGLHRQLALRVHQASGRERPGSGCDGDSPSLGAYVG